MPKETIKIDSKLLAPCRAVARVLGITLNRYIERELQYHVNDIDPDDEYGQCLVFLAEMITASLYGSREYAEGISERFEAFAVGAKLDGKPVGTIATNVVPTNDGRWMIKVDYLSPSAKRGWRKIRVLGDSEDDDEELPEW